MVRERGYVLFLPSMGMAYRSVWGGQTYSITKMLCTPGTLRGRASRAQLGPVGVGAPAAANVYLCMNPAYRLLCYVLQHSVSQPVLRYASRPTEADVADVV